MPSEMLCPPLYTLSPSELRVLPEHVPLRHQRGHQMEDEEGRRGGRGGKEEGKVNWGILQPHTGCTVTVEQSTYCVKQVTA